MAQYMCLDIYYHNANHIFSIKFCVTGLYPALLQNYA